MAQFYEKQTGRVGTLLGSPLVSCLGSRCIFDYPHLCIFEWLTLLEIESCLWLFFYIVQFICGSVIFWLMKQCYKSFLLLACLLSSTAAAEKVRTPKHLCFVRTHILLTRLHCELDLQNHKMKTMCKKKTLHRFW